MDNCIYCENKKEDGEYTCSSHRSKLFKATLLAGLEIDFLTCEDYFKDFTFEEKKIFFNIFFSRFLKLTKDYLCFFFSKLKNKVSLRH